MIRYERLRERLIRSWPDLDNGSFASNARYWEALAADKARDVREIVEGGGTGLRGQIVDYLRSKGFPGSGHAVLDVGCSDGKFALEFARTAARVTGMDISPTFCAKTLENAARLGLGNVDVLTRDFTAYDPEAEGALKRYDLVFANLTPGTKSFEGFQKLRAMSRSGCFVSFMVAVKWPVYEEIASRVTGEATGEPRSRIMDLQRPFNLLCLEGILPETALFRTSVSITLPVSDAMVRAIERMWSQRAFTEDEKAEMLRLLRERADGDGLLTTVRSLTIGSLFWTENRGREIS